MKGLNPFSSSRELQGQIRKAKVAIGPTLLVILGIILLLDPILSNTRLPNLKRPAPAVKVTQELEDLWPRDDSFYFIESSGLSWIHPRFKCSIESAALHHPSANIYVIVTSALPIFEIIQSWSRAISSIVCALDGSTLAESALQVKSHCWMLSCCVYHGQPSSNRRSIE